MGLAPALPEKPWIDGGAAFIREAHFRLRTLEPLPAGAWVRGPQGRWCRATLVPGGEAHEVELIYPYEHFRRFPRPVEPRFGVRFVVELGTGAAAV